MTQLLKRMWSEQEAQNLSEYALLLLLISLTAVTAMGNLATRLGTAYSGASTYVETTSRSGSFSGGSLSLGTQTSTNKPYPSRNDTSMNPK